ncbi:unnamed protein product [Clavelina lepadiformis]|uniref:BHLH domain-containing protein n=1 Tax=Clavelina lepadiformis TaxID=159417 RepID=A0ABP0GI64_CLALP
MMTSCVVAMSGFQDWRQHGSGYTLDPAFPVQVKIGAKIMQKFLVTQPNQPDIFDTPSQDKLSVLKFSSMLEASERDGRCIPAPFTPCACGMQQEPRCAFNGNGFFENRITTAGDCSVSAIPYMDNCQAANQQPTLSSNVDNDFVSSSLQPDQHGDHFFPQPSANSRDHHLKRNYSRHRQCLPNRRTDVNDIGIRHGFQRRHGASHLGRFTANVRERDRMRVLSVAFDELKEVLPWIPPNTRLSKLETLKLACFYINHLDRILEKFHK